MRIRTTILVAAFAVACGGDRRFPVRNPMWHDGDLASVSVQCRSEPTAKNPHHVSCAPKEYTSPLYWDGVDNLIFRPLSEAMGVVTSGESVNVNSLDEVPDSAWFQNRIGRGWLGLDELRAAGCTPDQILDPDHAADGSWVVDKGKAEGSTGGFRINVPGKGKYMVKTEDASDHAERQSASSVVGAAIYHAAGYNTSCEQVIYIRPSVLKLTPGLKMRSNFQAELPFDSAALDKLLKTSTHRGGLVRVSASAWLHGHLIGPFRYQGTREDDPNDVIPHENRRDIRAIRLLAAWIDRFDAREENSMDTWIADRKEKPESSPGHVVHYQLDTSEALGGDWGAFGFGESVSRRLGRTYVIDWGDIGADFITLGILTRPWDRVHVVPGHELFGYFTVDGFEADQWKNEYPNIAFSRMTERDGAWMARILAHFTPEMLQVVAEMGNFTDASQATYLAGVLEGRLERLLERYLLRLSPISDLHIEPGDQLCGVDLAEQRHVRDSALFHYAAQLWESTPRRPLAVSRKPGAKVCVGLEHAGRSSPYMRIAITDGVAKGTLLAHVYDLGANGFKLVGLERPSP